MTCLYYSGVDAAKNDFQVVGLVSLVTSQLLGWMLGRWARLTEIIVCAVGACVSTRGAEAEASWACGANL